MSLTPSGPYHAISTIHRKPTSTLLAELSETLRQPVRIASYLVERTRNSLATLMPTGPPKLTATLFPDSRCSTEAGPYPGVPRSNLLSHYQAPKQNTLHSPTRQKNYFGIASSTPSSRHSSTQSPTQSRSSATIKVQ